MANQIALGFATGAATEAGKLAMKDPEKLRERAQQIDEFVVERIRPANVREEREYYNYLTTPLTVGAMGAVATGNMPAAYGCIAAATAVEARSVHHETGGCVIL